MVPALNRLGEPLWRPSAPKGFGDQNDDWLDGVAYRLDTAIAGARTSEDRLVPNASLQTALGPLASAETRAPCPDASRNETAGNNAVAHGPGNATEMTLHAKHHAATRRELLLGSGTLFAWAFVPKIALAEGRDPRFLTIVLRGALDGLAAVAPVGDPDWIKLRGDNALRLDGTPPALPLDGFFALNPAMPNFHRLYLAGHAIVVHAVATPYRERSHFDQAGHARKAVTRERDARIPAGSIGR